jgi:hypothetical protein
MPDLIFVAIFETWDEVWRRNQFICSKLAKRFPKSKILFVGQSRDIISILRAGGFKGLLGKTIRTT